MDETLLSIKYAFQKKKKTSLQKYISLANWVKCKLWPYSDVYKEQEIVQHVH